jgi:transcriptional regulator
MYIPSVNRIEDRATINAFLHDYGFATLVTDAAGQPCASHLPVLFDEAAGALRSHMARANEQWRHFAPDKEVLCIFHGPHAYISPSWYVNQHAVPTWNYAAIHVYGVPAIVSDPVAVKQIVLDTTAKYESPRPQPWTLPLSELELAALLKAIVGFTIKITRIEAKFKLGQNRSAEDRAGTVRGLLATGQSGNVELAEFTRGQLETWDSK